jgi:hypothetical protein
VQRFPHESGRLRNEVTVTYRKTISKLFARSGFSGSDLTKADVANAAVSDATLHAFAPHPMRRKATR